MRRVLRNIIVASVLVVITIALFAHRRADLEDSSSANWAYGSLDDVGGSYAVRPGDDMVLKEPNAPPLIPPPDHIPVDSKPEVIKPLDEVHPVMDPKPFKPDMPLAPPAELPRPSPDMRFGDDSNAPEFPSGPVQPEETAFKAEFPFQKDLDLDLPIEIFKELSNNKPHNYHPDGPKTYAYATFMATRNPSLKDPYYLAIHSLIYRILWAPRSRSDKYPFIVFVASHVTPEQRALLRGAGAIVRELSPLEWNPNVPGVQSRWKDLFAKLNMWKQTDFSRILFLDADAFPLANLDAMFDVPPMQQCQGGKVSEDDKLADGTSVCEPYVFAGVPQQPFNTTDPNINVGSMVFTPSDRMHQRLLQNYVKTDRYNCLMAEQAFLNWQFEPLGAFPATSLQREWGGFFPSEDEAGKLKVVHEKLWSYGEVSWMGKEWVGRWREMLFFYSGDGFSKLREMDGEE
ncbi:nucleotide-diphospho-sugar transferase [Massarina eburnea CBS 473.64]|uniref:Nucleotide-diphospho-sugar transferase n=1 Tax=Massarina eburnea CBS 473.64 TaxID=1395130 RepID=A0A6A6SJY2_9PLEO|nr:nucleotide-diphospho-sugar transferase [Massarina eburnea CBS 473.64]